MAYNVLSGEIEAGRLYKAYSDGLTESSISYGGPTAYVTDTTFLFFVGVPGITTYTTTGTVIVEEVLELKGGEIEYVENVADAPTLFNEVTEIRGFAVEFDLSNAEKIVQETTRITGFAIELIDYPFYSFSITETRL